MDIRTFFKAKASKKEEMDTDPVNKVSASETKSNLAAEGKSQNKKAPIKFKFSSKDFKSESPEVVQRPSRASKPISFQNENQDDEDCAMEVEDEYVAQVNDDDEDCMLVDEKPESVKKKLNSSAKKEAVSSAQGSKKVPEGKEESLKGMAFAITGKFSSLTRDEVNDLVLRCGGRVTSTVTSKTTYLIAGEEPGSSKVNKANSLNIPTLTEATFLTLVRFQASSTPKENPKEKAEDVAEEKPKKTNFWARKSAAPSALGSKEVPMGVEDSLLGKTFVITGQLSSVTRDDVGDLIKRCGGRVTSAVSSKTSYLIVGEDAGETKINKAKSLGTLTLDEDQFFDLVRSFEGQAKPTTAPIEKTPAEKKVKTIVRPPKATTDIEALDSRAQLWVDKYKPKNLKELCGNNSNIEQLSQFLVGWDSRNLDAKSTRAVLLSGPPGIGKTTAAHLACQAAGFSPIEFNASDTRSKSSLEDLLSQFIDNRSISEFFKPVDKPKVDLEKCRSALILDEIDGMSGGDRGGVAEIIKYIKRTKVPIICICNDRQSPKVKSLANYCLDLKFRRPTAASIKGRIEMIAQKEGLSLSSNVIEKLFEMSNSDIRQVINLLSTWRLSSQTMNYDEGKNYATQSQKNMVLNPFQIIEKYMSIGAFRNHTLADRLEFYFHDFQIAPLMVQENYLRCRPQKISNPVTQAAQHLELLSEAADCISMADIVDRSIHISQNWGLMPVHAAYSCAMPSQLMNGYFNGMYNFPGWLGQNSKGNKYSRLLREAHLHVRSRVSGNKNELRQFYLPTLVSRLTQPLIQEGQAGIPSVMRVMDHYFLEKDDWDALIELRTSRDAKDPLLASIPTAVKSAFTRSYNKATHPTIVHGKIQPGSSKGSGISNAAAAAEMDDVLAAEDDTVEPDEEGSDSDSPNDDKLVAQKTAPVKRKASTASTRGAKKPRGRGK